MENNIIQKISLKPETTEQQFRTISRQLDVWGKLLADEIEEDGTYYLIAQFDDGIDFLAFLVSVGLASFEPTSTAEPV
jgi:hypothetical protein